ncbi:MAG: type I restriction endonuclease subunit R [Alkalibacterium sp.]|nr:type I restriction endonuclease subunit R [Alkalibacterium sp.]
MSIQDDERRFEQDIETYLLTQGGYTKGSMKDYDTDRAINLNQLLDFVKETQPKQWKRYELNYQGQAEEKFYNRLNDEINHHGLLHVLRHGIEDRGAKVKVAAFRPESSLNGKVIADYQANRLTVTRQFAYSSSNRNTLDMAISLNGIPIIALELKNQIKSQSVTHAKRQFKEDRNPRELCFQFNKRFLVYFAVDLYEAWMTTHLKGKQTYFLPFNQGSKGAGIVGGKGNPDNPTGYSTSYLWEKVLQKDNLMEILQRFMSLEGDPHKGKIIFPRYHQWDVVSKLVHHTRTNGSGRNYLIQHSAGSGKSNSIAWLAYRLSSLHNQDDESVYSSVIVVTDRRVLDQQLQKTIASFDHVTGLVETIDDRKSSQDLKDAINAGKKIIVTTLQKFPIIYNEVDSANGRNFAVIVDEAHSSQTGSSAQKLKTALADTEAALREYAEIEAEEEENQLDGQDKLVKELLSHGRHDNLSFFAFTATPKEKTLEMFGSRQEDGTFKPFHTYSMRQAIEEGFILDVLKNYTTYKTAYRIARETEDNPEVPETQALKAIKRFESLHPYNLNQKTAIMVEQFREVTQQKIKGKGKAMIVTPSRLHAVRYFKEIKAYIQRKGYRDMDVLVAFSGTVNDKSEEYTENKLNTKKNGKSISSDQIKAEFNTEEFNVIVVAEKFQTGFDEPLLHTMFVDKKLSGVKAVQTLSRLNRTHPDKNDTFVLDFVNEAEEIQEAFEPYYEETTLNEAIDVNLVYDTKNKLRKYVVYNQKDVDDIMKIYNKKGPQDDRQLGQFTSALKPIINRYLELDESQQYEFRVTLRNFVKWYAYITQLTRMFDQTLHHEYIFARYLVKFLPKESRDVVDLDDKIKLIFFQLKKEFEGDVSLTPDTVDGELENVREVDANPKPPEEDEFLESIIKKINERFQGDFSDTDRVVVEEIYRKAIKGNTKLKQQANNSSQQMFEENLFPQEFQKIAQDSFKEQSKAFAKLFKDKTFYTVVLNAVSREVYKELRK